MIVRRIYAICAASSLVLFLATLSGVIYIRYLDRAAQYKDTGMSLFSMGNCDHSMTEVSAPKRTPSIGETFSISVRFNNDTKRRCKIDIFLYAAGFDKDPEEKMSVTLRRGISIVKWSLSAKQPGNHAIQVNSGLEIRELNFTVLANHFFTQEAMEVILALSALLGSAATLAYWLDKRDKGSAHTP